MGTSTFSHLPAFRIPFAPSIKTSIFHTHIHLSVFVVETDRVVPELLLSFVRLMQLTAPEWTKAREKSKMPKPKALDAEGARVVCTALRARLAEYATTLEVCSSDLLPRHEGPYVLPTSLFNVPRPLLILLLPSHLGRRSTALVRCFHDASFASPACDRRPSR
jgi:hypothetical protein